MIWWGMGVGVVDLCRRVIAGEAIVRRMVF